MSTTGLEKDAQRESEGSVNRWRRMFLPKQTGSLLDEVMPTYDFRGTVSELIHATPHQISEAMNAVTLGDMPLAYALGTLRYLPARLTGRQQGDVGKEQPFFQQLKAGGTVVLAEQRIEKSCWAVSANTINSSINNGFRCAPPKSSPASTTPSIKS